MAKCEMLGCPKQAQFLASWTRDGGYGGIVEQRRVCVDHASADAADPPRSVAHFPEDLTAERRRIKDFRSREKKAVREAIFPGSETWGIEGKTP